jgi:hypothetical protein
MVKMQVADTK